MAEAGIPDFQITMWFGVFAPARTPPDVVWMLAGKIAPRRAEPNVKDMF